MGIFRELNRRRAAQESRFAMVMDGYVPWPGGEMIRPVPRPPGDDAVQVVLNTGSHVVSAAAAAKAMRELTARLTQAAAAAAPWREDWPADDDSVPAMLLPGAMLRAGVLHADEVRDLLGLRAMHELRDAANLPSVAALGSTLHVAPGSASVTVS